MTSQPQGALIEIIERTDRPDEVEKLGVIVPNEVRINGQPLLVSSDDPVIVHAVSTLGDSAVKVTLTVFARRVVYGVEPDGIPVKDASGKTVRLIKAPS